MPPQATILESNAHITPESMPCVAVFTGATAGIARATLIKLVRLGTPITVYVIGRNGPAHEEFLDEVRRLNERAKIVWLEGQVSLLEETRRLCKEIKSREKTLDLLFLSAGYVPLGGRRETSEGYDASITMSFWGRALFIKHLLPLLRASTTTTTATSSSSSHPPRIISIYAAGMESASIPLDDLDLRSPANFGVQNWAKTCATLNTVYLDTLATKPENKGVVFIHNHPGQVNTDILLNGWGEGSWGPLVMKWVVKPLMGVVMSWFHPSISPEESGENSLFLITSAMFGGEGVDVPLSAGLSSHSINIGRTLQGREDGGGLFAVVEKIETIQPGEVVGKLCVNGGRDKIVSKTEEVLRPYAS